MIQFLQYLAFLRKCYESTKMTNPLYFSAVILKTSLHVPRSDSMWRLSEEWMLRSSWLTISFKGFCKAGTPLITPTLLSIAVLKYFFVEAIRRQWT